jgi:hypothetical protein
MAETPVAHLAHARPIGRGGDGGLGDVAADALALAGRGIAVEPERRFGLVQDDFRVRIDGGTGIVDQPVGMVGMEMGEKDGLDIFRRDAEGAQIVRKLAERRPHGVAGAGIDQRPSPRALEQERVHRDRHVVFPAGEPLALGLVHAEHDIERRRQHAVAQRRDRDVADLFALRSHGACQALAASGRGRSAPCSRR